MSEGVPVSPPPDDPAPPRVASPRRVWRWLRRGALGLLALLGLVVALLACVFFTEAGTAFALRRAIAIYDDMIPGGATLGAIEGTLADGVAIDDVRLEDRHGEPLVVARRLKLRLDPWALATGAVRTGTIRIDGLGVYLPDPARADEGGGFADLGPEGPTEPEAEPPSEHLGPDLPVSIDGAIALEDAAIYRATGPTAVETWITVSELAADVTADGLTARTRLHARLAIPEQDLDVHWLALEVTWDDPGARVPTLFVQSSAGVVELDELTVDLERESASLGSVALVADAGWLQRRTGVALDGDPHVRLTAAGSTDAFSLDADVRVPGRGELAAALAGQLVPVPDLQLLLDGELAAMVDVTGRPVEGLTVRGAADLFGGLAEGIDARLGLTCRGCVQDVGPLRLAAAGHVDAEATTGFANATITAPGISVDADAGLVPGGVGAANVQILVEQLASLRPVLAQLGAQIDLAGWLQTEATCTGVVEAGQGVCRLQAGLQDGKPLRTAQLDTTVAVRGPQQIALELSALSVEARGVSLALRDAPATARYDPERVSVHGLRVQVRTRTGTGRIEVDGDVGLSQPPRVDARVRLDNVALAAANAFVPELDAAGTLDAAVDAQGTASAPRLRVDAHGRSLRLAGFDLGDLDLKASYADGQARADLDLAGADVGVITIDAKVPVALDLEASRVAALGRGGAVVDAMWHDVPLGTAAKLSPSLSTLHGRLGGELHLRRSLRRPSLTLSLDVEQAELDAIALPRVHATARYADAQAVLHVDATHPTGFDTLTVDAEVPVALDLSRGRARWHPAQPHALDVVLVGGRLREVTRLAPAVAVGGRVDARVHLRGDMHHPRVDAEVHAHALSYDDRLLGDVAASVRLDDDTATVAMHASGPAISGVGLDATIPVSVSLAEGRVQWLDDRDHRIRLSINELLVAEAMAWLPPPKDPTTRPLALGGRLDASVALDGPPTAPRVTITAHLDDASFDRRDVGEVEVAIRYGSGHADVDALWTQSADHTVRLIADVPLDVDLARGTARWQRDATHHVRIGAPRIDRALLSPFLDTGELDAVSSLYVVADGTLEAFDASASLTGLVGARGEKHRIQAKLVADETTQTLVVHLGVRPDGKGWARIDARADTPIPALLDGADWRATTFSVRADIDDIDLRNVAAFAPRQVQGLAGRLDAHAVVDGTFGAPRIDGKLELRDGEATIVPARQHVEDVALSLVATNEAIDVRRLHLRSAGGSVDGSGHVGFTDGAGMRGNVSLKIDQIPIRSPGLPRMAFTGKVDTQLDATADRLGVGVTVARARVDVFTSKIKAARPIATNDHVAFVDLDAAPDDETAAGDTSAPPPPPPQTDTGRTVRVRVELTDPVAIVGPSIDMTWGGEIETTTSPSGTTAADGALEAARGGFALLGNDFDITRGTVTLPEDGSNVPFLDLAATTTVDGVDITATIRGALPKPELVLSSSPAMSQSEVFTILVTGSADTADADPDEVEAKAAGVLAAMTNPALQQQLNDTLHVDKVGVGFGETTDQPVLTVGKRINRKVYAETQYHHNAPKTKNRAELRVEYDFAPRWSIETFFGDAAAGGVDLFWGRAFDRPAKSE